jgi:2-oxoglutarate ferredoxin oxidoreductase subunit beta
VVTGLLYVDEASDDMHAALSTVGVPLNSLADGELVPGNAALEGVNASLR